MSKTARYWKINENNLSLIGFAVMLLFAAAMWWGVPLLEKRGWRTWAVVLKIVAAIGLVVCAVNAFV